MVRQLEPDGTLALQQPTDRWMPANGRGPTRCHSSADSARSSRLILIGYVKTELFFVCVFVQLSEGECMDVSQGQAVAGERSDCVGNNWTLHSSLLHNLMLISLRFGCKNKLLIWCLICWTLFIAQVARWLPPKPKEICIIRVQTIAER